jgi:hypothetical protein
VYRTADRAESWTPISGDLTNGGAVSAIAPAAANPSVLYVGTSDGRVWTTANGGQTWTQRTLPIASLRYVQAIAVDARDPQTAWVTVSGFLAAHVFRTTNGGASFQDVSGNLPDVPVNAVVADPTSRAVALVGTDLGVFATGDSGGTWTPLTDGMPNVAVYDLAYNANTGVLLAGTHGRGVFALDLIRPLTLAVSPAVRRDTVPAGDAAVRGDSAMVIMSGANAATAGWSATHGGASWLALTTSSGIGTSRLRWTRSAAGLAAGVYVDTIRVTAAGAVDSPWDLLDTLVVRASVAVSLAPASHQASAIAGATSPVADSAVLSLVGPGADTTSWTAVTVRGAAWITIGTPSGTGSGTVRWVLDPTDLQPGSDADTIAVRTSQGDSARVDVSLLITAPAVTAACAAQELLGTVCLDDTGRRYLDLAGNRDGTFNLGDFLALLARAPGANAPGGRR